MNTPQQAVITTNREEPAKLRDTGETDELPCANYKWETAEWAYEAWRADSFTGVYRDLAEYRKSLSDSEADYALYKKSVHECMISALERMHAEGFFGEQPDEVTLFISSSDDDDAFEMENKSAMRLNSEQVYLPFLKRYGEDDHVVP